MILWLGNKVSAKVRGEAVRRVNEAALYVENATKLSMKRGGRTESGFAQIRKGTKRVKEDVRTGAKAGKIGSFRSKAGEVPRVQTGTLRRSIGIERAKRATPVAKVGTNLKYGRHLELGTKNMKRRPFLRPALIGSLPMIRAIFARPMGPKA